MHYDNRETLIRFRLEVTVMSFIVASLDCCFSSRGTQQQESCNDFDRRSASHNLLATARWPRWVGVQEFQPSPKPQTTNPIAWAMIEANRHQHRVEPRLRMKNIGYEYHDNQLKYRALYSTPQTLPTKLLSSRVTTS
jgi:hypothetical protein